MSLDLPRKCSERGRSCSDEEPDPLCPMCMHLAYTRASAAHRYWVEDHRKIKAQMFAVMNELHALKSAIKTIRSVWDEEP